MLGIGGALQNPSQHRPPADKHSQNVRRIMSLDPSSRTKGDGGEASKFGDDFIIYHKKRKKELQEKIAKKRKMMNEKEEAPAQETGFTIPLAQIVKEGKSELQGDGKRNGVTFAFMGSSGCGKSSAIRKVFIEQVFGKEATKGEEKEFIIQIFTESSKSDAFKDLDKSILVDTKGLDEDNINFCYHMNEEYDKRYNFFIILDDVLDINYKQLVRRMFLTMRNTNISSLVSLQWPNLIPKSIRTSVYFSLCFHFNNLEGAEVIIRGWMSRYLPGKNIREKIDAYLDWTSGADGHRMFFLDNLNHRVFRVDENYMCEEMMPLTQESMQEGSAKMYKSIKDPEEDKSDVAYQ